MRFLVDRCAGRRLAEALREQGHDVLEARTLDPDPGDRALLATAESAARILVTIDTDFGELTYLFVLAPPRACTEPGGAKRTSVAIELASRKGSLRDPIR